MPKEIYVIVLQDEQSPEEDCELDGYYYFDFESAWQAAQRYAEQTIARFKDNYNTDLEQEAKKEYGKIRIFEINGNQADAVQNITIQSLTPEN